jgi:hypothetical protein
MFMSFVLFRLGTGSNDDALLGHVVVSRSRLEGHAANQRPATTFAHPIKRVVLQAQKRGFRHDRRRIREDDHTGHRPCQLCRYGAALLTNLDADES